MSDIERLARRLIRMTDEHGAEKNSFSCGELSNRDTARTLTYGRVGKRHLPALNAQLKELGAEFVVVDYLRGSFHTDVGVEVRLPG